MSGGEDVVRSRVCVLAGRARVDLDVPADVPVADLLPELAALAGLTDSEALPRAWVLSRVGGRRLEPEHSLADSGVADGALLELLPAPEVRVAVVSDRLDEVADAARDDRGPWRPAHRHRIFVTGGAVVLAAAAPMVATAGPPVVGAGAALLVAVLIGLTAAGLRRAGRPGAAAAAAGSGLAWWAATGVTIAVVSSAPAAVHLADAALGLLIGAILGALASGTPAPLAGAGLTAGLTLVGAMAAAGGLSPPAAAAVVALIAATLPAMVPGVVVRAGGVERYVEAGRLPAPGDACSEQPSPAAVVVRRARTLSTWLLAGDLIALAAACAVLGAAGGGWGVALGLLAAAAAALRSRLFRSAAEVIVLVAGALLSAGALTATVAIGLHSDNLRLLGIGTAVVGAALLAVAPVGQDGGPRTARRLDRVRVAVDMALVPVALGALGVYSALRHTSG